MKNSKEKSNEYIIKEDIYTKITNEESAEIFIDEIK